MENGTEHSGRFNQVCKTLKGYLRKDSTVVGVSAWGLDSCERPGDDQHLSILAMTRVFVSIETTDWCGVEMFLAHVIEDTGSSRSTERWLVAASVFGKTHWRLSATTET